MLYHAQEPALVQSHLDNLHIPTAHTDTVQVGLTNSAKTGEHCCRDNLPVERRGEQEFSLGTVFIFPFWKSQPTYNTKRLFSGISARALSSLNTRLPTDTTLEEYTV